MEKGRERAFSITENSEKIFRARQDKQTSRPSNKTRAGNQAQKTEQFQERSSSENYHLGGEYKHATSNSGAINNKVVRIDVIDNKKEALQSAFKDETHHKAGNMSKIKAAQGSKNEMIRDDSRIISFREARDTKPFKDITNKTRPKNKVSAVSPIDKSKTANKGFLSTKSRISMKKAIKRGGISHFVESSGNNGLQTAKRTVNLYKNSRRAVRYTATSIHYTKAFSKVVVNIAKSMVNKLITGITSKALVAVLPIVLLVSVSIIPFVVTIGVVMSLLGWMFNTSTGETAAANMMYYQVIINDQLTLDRGTIDSYVNPLPDDYGAFAVGSDTEITVNFKDVLAVLIVQKLKLESEGTVNDLMFFDSNELLAMLSSFYNYTVATETPYYCGGCSCPGHYNEETDETTYCSGCQCDGHHTKYVVSLNNYTRTDVMGFYGFDEDQITQANLVAEQMDNILIYNLPSHIDVETNTLGWAFPLPELSGWYISSDYGYRTDPITGAQNVYHNGTDITGSGAEGTPVVSILDTGIVVDAGYSDIMGNFVKIYHSDHNGTPYYVTYMHMLVNKVHIDDEVAMGDVIGAVGNTGRSTGAHLHISIEHTGRYNYVNPWYWIDPEL
ncbi:MAG: M23 family metallopeptidase [Vallitaleaceae bacterium]|jgi:hypothetical protein|nr:M23 family metallopeptidase [Vallitaleaceae bacterium]